MTGTMNSSRANGLSIEDRARIIREGLSMKAFVRPEPLCGSEPLMRELIAPDLGECRSVLIDTRNVLGVATPKSRRLMGRILRPFRRLAKLLTRPWWEHQTVFNTQTVDAINALTYHNHVTAVHVNVLVQKISTNLAGKFDEALDRMNRRVEQFARELHLEQRDLRAVIDTLSVSLEREIIEARAIRESLAEQQELNHLLSIELATTRDSLSVEQERVNEERTAREQDREAHGHELVEVEKKHELKLVSEVNRQMGFSGTIADHGLYFNPPINVEYHPEHPKVSTISERILEHIYVHRMLPAPPCKLLDLGCAESTNSLEMASLGFDVVGVDLRRLPLTHPKLEMVVANLADLPFPDESFDCVVSLSTIEHVGLGWYNKEEKGTSREQVMEEVYRVLRPGGKLIITVPFGKSGETPVHKVFSHKEFNKLLGQFRVTDQTFGIRKGETWTVTDDAELAGSQDSVERVSAVAMYVAEKE